MARVDFYILDAGDAGAREAVACRLAEKAWQQGHRVLVRTADAAAAARLDELLWTFRQNSFVPHAVVDEADGEPVLIGAHPPAGAGSDVLINLADEVPADWEGYARVAEIVSPEPGVRDRARARYRRYREAGVEPDTHRLAG